MSLDTADEIFSMASDVRSQYSVGSSKSGDPSGSIAGKISKKQLYTQTKWETNYDCLLIMATSCMSIRDGIGMIVKDTVATEPCIIHYIIIYIIVLIPMAYTQIFIGQYSQLGISLFKHMTPLGHGLTYCFLMHSIYDCILDGVFLSYYVLYLLSCIRYELEWMVCPEGREHCWGANTVYGCYKNCITDDTVLSSFVYWSEIFLQRPRKFIDVPIYMGVPLLAQSIGIVGCWSLIYIISYMGFSRYMKIVRIVGYSVAVMILLLLLVIILTSGAVNGLIHMFYVPRGCLSNLTAWSSAICRSCSMATMGQVYTVMYGSYMSQTMRSEYLTSLAIMLNFVITLYISTLMNATTGILVIRAGVDLSHFKVIWEGITLPQFSILPEGLGFLGAANLWTAIYFLIGGLFTLISLVSRIDVIEKSISEAHHHLRNYRTYALAGITSVACVAGILMSSTGSQQIIREIIIYVQPATNMFEIFVFSILVYWVYKVQRLSDDIHFLTGQQPAQYFKICWYIMPFVIAVPFVHFSILNINIKSHCTNFLHYSLIASLTIPLPILLLINVFRYLRMHNLISIVQPEERWGPPDPRERHLRRMFNPREETRQRRRNDACKHKCLLQSKILDKAVTCEKQVAEEDMHLFVTPSSFSIGDD